MITPKKRTASQVGKSNVQTSKVHERRVAHLLTDWTGIEFRRRRVEGRMADTIARDLTGDVIPVDRLCHFNIECKKGQSFSLDAMLASIETCQFTKWYHQSSYDAKLCSEQHKKIFHPMLFFKPVPNWDWVAIPTAALEFLRPLDGHSLIQAMACSQGKFWAPHLIYDAYDRCGEISHNVAHTKKAKNKVMVPLRLQPCFICRWRDFAAHVDPESFLMGDDTCVGDVEKRVLPSE